MTTASAPRRPAFIPALVYKDNRAALQWLQQAFGFDVSEVLVDSSDNIAHAEMTHADGLIMIGSEWADWTRSPSSLGGKNTQRIHVRIEKDIDEHCRRARKAGAIIEKEPEDQFYGERTYMAVDPEGHHWTFSQRVQQVSVQQMEAASGLKFKPLK
jgi:uncharacterized glyoxalase superfamily protein PhnB